MLITAIITIAPISLAAIVEHVGDVCAISSTVNKNFVAEPGLHRTLMGDGLATTLSALLTVLLIRRLPLTMREPERESMR